MSIRSLRGTRGFTIVELIIVIVIIGLLAMMAFLGFQKYTSMAAEKQVVASLKNAATAANAYQLSASAGAGFSGLDMTTLADAGFKPTPTVTVSVVSATAETYCLQATSSKIDSRSWHTSDVDAGIVLLGDCPAAP